MGDEASKTKDEKRVSIFEAFEISDLLPGGVTGGVAFEILQLEARKSGAMTEGDVATIYNAVLQGFGQTKNKLPEGFTYSAVREHYNL